MKPPRRPHSGPGRPPSAPPGDARPGGRADRPFQGAKRDHTAHGGKSGAAAPAREGQRPRLEAPRPRDDAQAPRRPEGKPPFRGERAQDDRRPGPRQERHGFADRPAAAREAPGGSLWLYGAHAVAAALANPARRLRRLLLSEEAEAALATRLPRPWPIGVERTERARIDHLLGAGAIHQGAALLVDPLQPPSLQSVVDRPGPVLVLDQVGDPRNVGAILRAAAAFGVAAVITQDRNAPEETGALAKAASGALETVPLLRAVNIARTLIALRAAGFWVVGLDAGGGILSGPALGERRVALVLGNEGEGLRRLTRDTCDEIAGIAMPGASGQLESLNVSAAAAIALYELARGRPA